MLIGCFGEVNEAMLAYVTERLIEASNTKEKVTIMVSTYGGEMYPALGIYDMISLHSKNVSPVTTIATGPCMSAGMVIHQAGAKRAMTEHAQLMTHYGEDGADSEGTAKHNKFLHSLHKELVGKKTKASKAKITTWFRQETYFTATKALKLGLVDEVIKND